MEDTFRYFYFMKGSKTPSHELFRANMLYMRNKAGKVHVYYTYGEAPPAH